MLQNILFDLDDTILDFHWAEKNALIKMLLHFNIEPTENILNRYSEINLMHWKMFEKGMVTREELKIRRYKQLFEEFHIEGCSPKEATAYYEEMLGKGHCFVEGAEEMLKLLSQKYNLYIVSNGTNKAQKGRIKSAEIERYVKGIFTSEEIGFAKPCIDFFEKCFSDIDGFDKNRSIIVGDSLTSDILGGINFGIKTVWFNKNRCENKSGIIPDYEITKLSQLKDIT